uniref:Uncharacterized protein n=1 Tax=Romanomermis culicivorax TaxID=13658 RepID=A0A915KQA7_ROMCU
MMEPAVIRMVKMWLKQKNLGNSENGDLAI